MSLMLPFIEVSHLPSSTSFYSAATQPLGLRYIAATNSPGSPSVTYGSETTPPVPVFELRQVKPSPGRPLKRARIAFSAPSREAVAEFQEVVREVKEENQKAAQFGDQSLLRHPEGPEELFTGNPRTGSGSSRLPDKVRETDIDGNIMEVAYVPPQEYPERYGGSTVRRTQSTQSEVSRILNWNYDVASAEPVHEVSLAPLAPASSNLVSPRRPGRASEDEQASVPRRSASHSSTTLYEAAGPSSSSSILNPGGMMGALMGVAAGAAIGAGITYGVMRGGPQESETPAFQRSSTFPEPTHDNRGRYAEYDRPAKEVQHRDDYTLVADRRPPPTILTRYTHTQVPLGRSREVDDVYEGRSRQTSRSKPPGLTSMRSRSEMSANRQPLLLTDAEHRYVSSKHGDSEDRAQDHRGHSSVRHSSRTRYTPAEPQSMRRSLTYHVGADRGVDRDTYGSGHGQRTTTSGIRAPLAAGGPTELASRSAPKSTSRTAAAASQDKPRRSNSYKSARDVPLPVSRAASYVSPRDVPLPASRSGMSYVSPRHVPLPSNNMGVPRTEKWEDDLESIAPSDSISCVGARRNQRVYR